MDQINNIILSTIEGDKDSVTNFVNDILSQKATQALVNYSTVEEEVSELDESEQLDELSKDTLKSYLNKTIRRSRDFQNKGDAELSIKKANVHYDKADNVIRARNRASNKIDKLTK